MRWAIGHWRLAVGGWSELAGLDSLGQSTREKAVCNDSSLFEGLGTHAAKKGFISTGNFFTLANYRH